jgi:hypothetical protein
MERFLDTYIERMRGEFSGIPPATAHEIASVFIQYKFGLYENAVRECTHAITLIPDSMPNAALKKALAIIRTNAEIRNNSQVTPDLSVTFSDAERAFVAIPLQADQVGDPATLSLDNAIIFIYAVALIASPDDEEALGEHRRFIVRMLTDYKKALGLA